MTTGRADGRCHHVFAGRTFSRHVDLMMTGDILRARLYNGKFIADVYNSPTTVSTSRGRTRLAQDVADEYSASRAHHQFSLYVSTWNIKINEHLRRLGYFLAYLMCVVWRQEGHPASKNKSIQYSNVSQHSSE